MDFCNRDCKLKWIFKKSDIKRDKGNGGNRLKEQNKPLQNMAVEENNPDDLDDYLKENKIKILRDT